MEEWYTLLESNVQQMKRKLEACNEQLIEAEIEENHALLSQLKSKISNLTDNLHHYQYYLDLRPERAERPEILLLL